MNFRKSDQIFINSMFGIPLSQIQCIQNKTLGVFIFVLIQKLFESKLRKIFLSVLERAYTLLHTPSPSQMLAKWSGFLKFRLNHPNWKILVTLIRKKTFHSPISESNALRQH